VLTSRRTDSNGASVLLIFWFSCGAKQIAEGEKGRAAGDFRPSRSKNFRRGKGINKGAGRVAAKSPGDGIINLGSPESEKAVSSKKKATAASHYGRMKSQQRGVEKRK